jgi:AmmeMemoRadiSam system protein A
MELDADARRQLLAIARKSIEAAVAGPDRAAAMAATADPTPGRLSEPAAAFVTIREQGELRGCIGLMRFDAPLWLNVRDAARSAALEDWRFTPVAAVELPVLELEVSVLEPPIDLPDPAAFEVGRHGVIIEKGMHRGLLLPQVATEQGWNAEQMLDGVCRKADLPAGAWRQESAHLQVFVSVCFGEADTAPE